MKKRRSVFQSRWQKKKSLAPAVILNKLELHKNQVFSYLEKKGIIKNAKNYEVGVFLIPNRELVAMKKEFLGKTVKKVDVLAFPEPGNKTAIDNSPRLKIRNFTVGGSYFFPHPETSKIPLGEIYLNREDAINSPDRSMFLLRHGLLHLLGYRHDRKRDTIKMQNLEKELEEYYDTGIEIHNRSRYRHFIHKSSRSGKSRRTPRA